MPLKPYFARVFTVEEDAQSYLICLREIVLDKGIRHGVVAWIVTGSSVATMITGASEEQLAGEQTPTQVGHALDQLGIEPIFALTPQAKGRVERLFNTLQDRLVQELRLAGITRTSRGNSLSSTAPSKRISTRGSQSQHGKPKLRGGHCPKDWMWIGSAALVTKRRSVTTILFGSEDHSWYIPPVRIIEAMLKCASRCTTSSMVAGVSTSKTSCYWRQRRLGCKYP